MIIRWIPAFALLGVALAQTPAPVETEKATLEGTVIHALTGEPLRRAYVTLRVRAGRASGGRRAGAGMAGPAGTTSTDASGRFVLANVEPGQYVLSAERNGFLRAEYGATRVGGNGTALEVSAGAVKRDLSIKLTPQGVVAGRVFDEEGEPMQGVFVQVLHRRYLRGGARWIPTASGETNDRGEFRVLNVEPGKYMVAARYGRVAGPVTEATGEGQAETGYALTYFPGVASASQAAMVEVTAGRESGGLEMRLPRSRMYRVKGQVLDASGGPARRAIVQAMPRDAVYSTSARMGPIREGGQFEITNLVPGSYTLVARSMDGGRDSSLTAVQAVELGEHNMEGIVLSLSSGVAIPGQVTVEGGATVSMQGIRVGLTPAVVQLPSSAAAVKEDGTFTIGNVSPMRYKVSVSKKDDGTYVKSVKVGGQEVGGAEFEIAAGAAPAVVVTLSGNGGQVTGMVGESGSPVAKATVVLVPEESRRSEENFRTATTGENGSFTMAGIAPGEYRAFAWEDVESGAWLDPEFLKLVESKGSAVKVQAGAASNVSLEAISAER